MSLIKILFVCTGNICRSPMAHAVMRAKVAERGLSAQFQIDSAGTHGYHIGESADPRARAIANARGVVIDDLRAQQLQAEDFYRYDWILAMDEDNINRIHERTPNDATAQVTWFLAPAQEAGLVNVQSVPDPYYGGEEGFTTVFELVEQGCEAWLARLTSRKAP